MIPEIPGYLMSDKFYPPLSPSTVMARTTCRRIGLVESTSASRLEDAIIIGLGAAA